jgi:DNA polymerase-1
VVAYKIAATIEKPVHWGDGLWTLHSDENEGIAAIDALIAKWEELFDAKNSVIALTDQEANWRLSVWPTYKAHRKATRKPLCLRPMREHLLANYRCYLRPRLEGDDVLGILATHPKLVPGRKIIVSADKDFYTIPGEFVRTTGDGPLAITEVSPEQAARFHLLQTIAGDTTDGYPGAPGWGMERASRALDEGRVLVGREHTITRGPRKGEAEMRWEQGPEGTPWEIVVSIYESCGLTEQDALIQARVARILHASDYNFDRKEPILWTP